MKTYTINVEPMGKSISKPANCYPKSFTEGELELAQNFWAEACATYLHDPSISDQVITAKGSDENFEAGGIGFDYRVTFETETI